MMRLFWIFLAGGLGSGARYLAGLWAADRLPPGFPYGTLIVNALGCFLIAAVMQLAAATSWNPEWRIAITVGFLGGFTTYSTFNFETMHLLQSGATAAAMINMAAAIASGLAAGWLGLVVARQLPG